VCSECSHEWNLDETPESTGDEAPKVLYSNGNELYNGDSVIVIKDLPVKGMSKPVKAGTKVKTSDLVRATLKSIARLKD